jgi:hypothetical protein
VLQFAQPSKQRHHVPHYSNISWQGFTEICC